MRTKLPWHCSETKQSVPHPATLFRIAKAGTIGVMSSAFAIATSGLKAAQLRLDSTAHNIADLGTPGFRRQSVAQQAVPDLGGVQAQSILMAQPGAALAQDVVDQMVASYAFKAHVLVLRTAREMTGSLLDVRA